MVDNTEYSVSKLITIGNTQLSNAKITNYKNEVLWFLSDVLNCNTIDLYLQKSKILSNDQLLLFNNYIYKRKSGEPFQYILGYSSFYGRDFYVDQNVLIPRPETEIIIDIIRSLKNKNTLLDIGTGSGCISITCALELLIENILSTDISNKAIDTAKKNSLKYDINIIDFIQHDLFNDSFNNKKFDVIVSNPPYIGRERYNSLEKHIIDFEPNIALTDFNDGLLFYRKFSEIAQNIMHNNSTMILEFGGNDQLNDIKKIFSNYKCKFHLDLQGQYRFIQLTL